MPYTVPDIALSLPYFMSSYDLNGAGLVQDPGKFEGQRYQTLTLWELALSGDGVRATDSHENIYTVFPETLLASLFPLDPAFRNPSGSWVVWEEDNGFVGSTYLADEVDDVVAYLEGS